MLRDAPYGPRRALLQRRRGLARSAAGALARRAPQHMYPWRFGLWRSLVARSVRVGEVPSSNLGSPITTPPPPAPPPAFGSPRVSTAGLPPARSGRGAFRIATLSGTGDEDSPVGSGWPTSQ